MLSPEQFHQQQFFQNTFGSDTSSAESYPQSTMDYYHNTNAYNNNFPFAFAPDGTAVESIKLEMTRTPSHNSLQNIYEYSVPMLSAGSIGSASSSTVGSPYSGPASTAQVPGTYALPQNFSEQQAIFYKYPDQGSMDDFTFMQPDNEMVPECNIVDPNLLSESQFYPPFYSHPSPTPSEWISQSNTHNGTRESSVVSRGSVGSPSVSGDEVQKSFCPYDGCGKHFKDLKAHMLTHQQTRPEKCPIINCPWNEKGFSRKYDKNRHVLTHYRGTMVCPFCPGLGSSAEKTFNRADVFKRHLTSVHNVEQNPPNSRKRNPGNSNKKLSTFCDDPSGKCSTCSRNFDNAQDFYEHLDECVLNVVQQEDSSVAFTTLNLEPLTNDPAVQESCDRNGVKLEVPKSYNFENNEDDDEEDEEEDDEEESEGLLKGTKPATRGVIGGHISKSKSNKRGMTWSKDGVRLVGKNRKRRRNYPPAWGMDADKMKMKKRVLCVYDGSHRLNKDDMMLANEYEVRLTLADGHSWVTDLDVQTLKRAEAFHNATPEEKLPNDTWIQAQELFTDGLF